MARVDKDTMLGKWERYFHARDGGLSVTKAAQAAGLAPQTAYDYENGKATSSGRKAAEMLGRKDSLGQAIRKNLSPEASRALHDFGYFRRRYFGRASKPWQEEVTSQLVDMFEHEGITFVVVNCPPGAGKTTLFSHDFPAWMIARDRSISVLLGSYTHGQAKKNAMRLRRTLERRTPMMGDARRVTMGQEFDAEGAMAVDFGDFKPENPEVWAADKYLVLQPNNDMVSAKEATVQAYGRDSAFLGDRVQLAVWDDLVDRKNTRSEDIRADLIDWWGEYAETRIEPGGLLVLVGQRMAADDLYRTALDETDPETNEPTYQHIVYKAHYEDRCKHVGIPHPKNAPAYPDGCLLDPQRLSWPALAKVRAGNRGTQRFNVQYQQEDADREGALIKREWVFGGRTDGTDYDGCLDLERVPGVIPQWLKPLDSWHVVTVDPSPTKNWGIHEIIFEPTTEQRVVIDTFRGRMSMPQFLTYNFETKEFAGLLEDWWQRGHKQGRAFKVLIVERNAAQRFMLQDEGFKRWARLRQVQVVGHDTYANKSDEKYGLESIADKVQFGKLRIPYHPSHRGGNAIFTQELVNLGQQTTNDTVMAWWFAEWQYPRLFMPSQAKTVRVPRPSFMQGRKYRRGLAGHR